MWFDLEILEASRFVRDSVFELAQTPMLQWPRLQVREAGGTNWRERDGTRPVEGVNDGRPYRGPVFPAG